MAGSGTVAAILPLFNERHAIAGLVRCRRTSPRRSSWTTARTTAGPTSPARRGAHVIAHGARRGVGAAIRTGIECARANGHWAVLVMAANGKDDPAEAPRLISELRAGYDYVQGSRYLRAGRCERQPPARA